MHAGTLSPSCADYGLHSRKGQTKRVGIVWATESRKFWQYLSESCAVAAGCSKHAQANGIELWLKEKLIVNASRCPPRPSLV